MTEAALPPIESPRRLRFDWVTAVFFRPRQAFARIASQTTGVWLTPVLILTLTGLLGVGIAGPIKQAAALSGTAAVPQYFQYWTPEQQAQFQEAISATNGPVFIYVFPALSVLVQVWGGWLLVGGLVHLVLTMLGGRGDTLMAMNLVAWSALPFAVRDVVRVLAMWGTKALVQAPGISGFAPAGEGGGYVFLSALLGLIDIYLIWHAALLILGVRLGNKLPTGKAIAGVLVALVLVLALQALPAYFSSRLGGLSISGPMF